MRDHTVNADLTEPFAGGPHAPRWVLVTIAAAALISTLALIWFMSRDSVDRLDHGHGGRLSITSLAVLPDGRVVAGEEGGGVRLWDLPTGTSDFFVWTQRAVAAVATLDDGRIASAGDDGELIVWNPDVDEMPTVAGDARVLGLRRLPDGRLASLDASLLRVWDADWTTSRVFAADDVSGTSIAVLADGRIAAGGTSGSVLVWDPAGTRTQPDEIPVSSAPIRVVAALADDRMVTGGDDGSLLIVDLDDPDSDPVELDRREAIPISVAVLDDGRVAIAWTDGRIAVHDPDRPDDRPRILDDGLDAPVLLALPDTRLAAGAADGVIRIWHLA